MQNKTTFIVAGILIVAAVVYLLISSTGTTAQYFLTVEELTAMGDEALNRNITVSGAVLGATIDYDAMGPRVTFTIVQVPGDPKEVERLRGLAQVLHDATQNPNADRLDIVYDSVKLSNRFVGPIIRFRKSIRDLSHGKTVQPIVFRGDDYWQELADDFNEMIERVQKSETSQGELIPIREADHTETVGSR